MCAGLFGGSPASALGGEAGLNVELMNSDFPSSCADGCLAATAGAGERVNDLGREDESVEGRESGVGRFFLGFDDSVLSSPNSATSIIDPSSESESELGAPPLRSLSLFGISSTDTFVGGGIVHASFESSGSSCSKNVESGIAAGNVPLVGETACGCRWLEKWIGQ